MPSRILDSSNVNAIRIKSSQIFPYAIPGTTATCLLLSASGGDGGCLLAVSHIRIQVGF